MTRAASSKISGEIDDEDDGAEDDIHHPLDDPIPAAQRDVADADHRQAAEIVEAQLILGDQLEGVGIDLDIDRLLDQPLRQRQDLFVRACR